MEKEMLESTARTLIAYMCDADKRNTDGTVFYLCEHLTVSGQQLRYEKFIVGDN